MAFADTITTVGNKIIALVNTRSKTDLSNITSEGESVIRNLASGSVPVGTVIAYMGTTEPDGYLLMDGRVLSQETYADLYNVVGVSQLPSGATESGGVYTWTDSNGITYSTGDGTDDATHKYKMFAIADMTDGRYLMGSTVAGTRNSVDAGIPDIWGRFSTGDRRTHIQDCEGALFASYIGPNFFTMIQDNGDRSYYAVGFQASMSDPTYGKSKTVTPLSQKTNFIIRY